MASNNPPIYCLILWQNLICFGSKDGYLHILELATNKFIKKIAVGSKPIFALIVFNNELVVDDGNGIISQFCSNFMLKKQLNLAMSH